MGGAFLPKMGKIAQKCMIFAKFALFGILDGGGADAIFSEEAPPTNENPGGYPERGNEQEGGIYPNLHVLSLIRITENWFGHFQSYLYNREC